LKNHKTDQENYITELRKRYVNLFSIFILLFWFVIEIIILFIIHINAKSQISVLSTFISTSGVVVLLILILAHKFEYFVHRAIIIMTAVVLLWNLSLPPTYSIYIIEYFIFVPILTVVYLEKIKEVFIYNSLFVFGALIIFLLYRHRILEKYSKALLAQTIVSTISVAIIIFLLNKQIYAQQKQMVKQLFERNKYVKLQELGRARDEAILKSIGNGLVVVDKSGDIQFINQAGEQMLGISRSEAINKPASEVLNRVTEKGEKIPYDKYVLTRILKGEKVEADTRQKYYFRKKNGVRFPVSIIVTPVIFKDEIVGGVEVFRDISEEVEIDQAKTEFVSLASHQLRTPLSSINWYTEMLLAGDAGKISSEQKKFLEEIYNGNQRMVTLVNSLLNVSRIEAGTLSISNKPVDIDAVIKSVIADLSLIINEKQLKVDFKDNIGQKITLLADQNIIHIIIDNVISNAVKYTPDKGHIEVNLENDNNSVILTVKDNGYGIPKNQQDKIFTKLFRADNAIKKVTNGTGLGLYMVNKLMDKLGGSIRFESEENEGTTFYVTWPIAGTREQRGSHELLLSKPTVK
jgi:PAS domain S-box-containing protein